MGIILDMDGTIVNGAPSIVRSLNEVFQKMGHEPLLFEEAVGLSGVPLDGILGARLSEDEIPLGRQMYREIQYATFMDDTNIFTDAEDVLAGWRRDGRRLAVFTLRRGDNARTILESFNLLNLFDGVVGCDEAKRPKPYPDHVEKAASFLAVRPENAIVVGDNLVDIQSGKRAGAKTIGVLWGMGNRMDLLDEGADVVAEDWKELDRIVRELLDE